MSDQNIFIPWVSLLAAISVFATIPLMFFCFTMIGPWRALAMRYQAQSRCTGHWLHWQSMHSNMFSFRNCVSICFTDDYLWLRLSPLLFPWAKEIQIPWTDIESISETQKFWTKWHLFALNGGLNLAFLATPKFERYITSHAQQIGMKHLFQ